MTNFLTNFLLDGLDTDFSKLFFWTSAFATAKPHYQRIMEPLTLKPRQPVEEDVECWDDDGDLQGIDDLQFRSASTATSVTSASQQHHRDSISSRLSTRSDLDSNHGDEDWQVLLPDDESPAHDAFALAKSKSIPIPSDVPKSALMGGTIKRLGGKKIKKVLHDDWSEDLEGFGGELKLAKTEDRNFPENLRQISAAFHKTPAKIPELKDFGEKTISPGKGMIIASGLEKFQDTEEDDFFGDVPTIKIAKSRSPQKPIAFAPPPTKVKKEAENMEEDLEFPADGEPLRLSLRKEHPRTPHQGEDDFDTEWAEGSLGTRFGGTKRERQSNRSSSVSAFSPSASSCLTGESEDEGLDGLILPDGPLKFEEVLKKRKETQSPDPPIFPRELHAPTRAAGKDDFFSGLEIGDGDVFDSAKLTLNRNIKHKTTKSTSPTRIKATTLTFTNKSHTTTTTRIPRLHQSSHERPRSTLEPVSESGAPASRYKRPGSRLGHSAHSSISSIPTPSMPSTPSTPSTPSRRGLASKPSRENLRSEPVTTTNAQLLKAKRSMPALRNMQSPSKPPAYGRPPSRNDSGGSRPPMPSRPKTPSGDRPESSLSYARRPPVPFLPAGSSQSQSHHISSKNSRYIRRNDSDGSNDGMLARPMSRLSGLRPETPGQRGRMNVAPADLAAAAKRPITKPTRRRNFGDGSELEVFDDLPTSATVESKFTKQPIGRGAPRVLRSKLSQSQIPPSSRTETPLPPSTPLSPTKQGFTPSFARDTAASRIAREQRQASITFNPRDRPGGPLASLSTNISAQHARSLIASPSTPRNPNRKPGLGAKGPNLIKQIGNGAHEPKCKLYIQLNILSSGANLFPSLAIKGMHYNPALYRWEGNENALSSFDIHTPIHTPSSPTHHASPKPAPALITHFGAASNGVQISGGMVFDPQRMCWLKMAEKPSLQHTTSGSGLRGGGMGSVQLDEEEDVFAGLEDLKEEGETTTEGHNNSSSLLRVSGSNSRLRQVSGESSTAGASDDKVVGAGEGSGDEGLGFLNVSEEFDVGPEFVRRQRAEEDRWRRKVERWIGGGGTGIGDGTREEGDTWRWAIRDLIRPL